MLDDDNDAHNRMHTETEHHTKAFALGFACGGVRFYTSNDVFRINICMYI